MHPHSRPLVAGTLLTVAVVSGCGGTAPDTEPGSGTTSLTIAMTPQPGAEARVWELTCDPDGGTHPRVADACAFLREQARTDQDPFAPVPDDVACTEIYGGPAVVSVEGAWLGEPVAATFIRTDGCQIDRWEKAQALLPDSPF